MKLKLSGIFRSNQRSKAMFAILVGAKAYTLTVSRSSGWTSERVVLVSLSRLGWTVPKIAGGGQME